MTFLLGRMALHSCWSPFVRMTQSPNGQLRTCVYSPPLKGTYGSIEEAFHSDEMETIRSEMRSDVRRPECEWCYRYEESGQYSCRQDINERYEGFDFKTNLQELDFSASNECNFICVTCNEDASSRWEQRVSEFPFFPPKQRQPLFSFPKVDSLKQLTLMGGEPILVFRKDFFVDLPPVEYFQMVTNASLRPPDYFKDYLSKCDNVCIGISCDGLGTVGEFVRSGWKQNVWERNVAHWLDFLGNDHGDDRQNGVWINFVISNYNVKQVPLFRKYCEDAELRLMLTVAEEPKCICPSYLDPELKNELFGLDEFVDEILYRSDENKNEEYISYTRYLNTFTPVPYEDIMWL